MKNRKLIPLLVTALFAVVLSACGTALAQAPDTSAVRTINVNGSAQAFLTPDIAYIHIGVQTENEDANAAVAENNAQAKQIIDGLKAAGIAAKDIRTSDFSIYTNREYTPEGQLGGTKYIVNNMVYVTVRDLPKVGDILNAAVEAGANNIHGIQFDVADKTTALSQARKAAIGNARELAEELAGAAGVVLGPIYTINFYGGNTPVIMYDQAAVKSLELASVPVETGQMALTVDVNIVFEIR